MSTQKDERRVARKGWMQLALASTTIAIIWFVVLPGLDRIDWVRERSQRLEEAGIEADAMFYTELNWKSPPGAYFR